MKKTFLFELKRYIIPLSIYMVIMTIIGFVIVLPFSGLTYDTFLNLFSFFTFILVIWIIYITFSYNKKRISADMTFSLPVTKRELFAGKYLAAISTIFASAIVYFLICLMLFGISCGLKHIYLWEPLGVQLSHYCIGSLIILVSILPLFNFLLLFYYKANTVLDGILFIILGSIIVYLVMYEFCNLASEFVYYSHVYPLAVYFNIPFIVVRKELNILNGVVFFIYLFLGYLLSLYLLWQSKREDSIRTHAICDGIFGYKVFYPIIGVFVPIVSFSGFAVIDVIILVVLCIGLFMGYCIYHRSPKFTKQSYFILGLTLGFDFLYFMGVWIYSSTR